MLAGGLFTFGVAVLVAVLTGLVGSSSPAPSTLVPAPVVVVAPTPLADPAERAAFERLHESTPSTDHSKQIVATPTALQQHRDLKLFSDQPHVHISKAWISGFYPVYATAQSTFGVNWLLLASIHMQESAFSTAASTYHGLNFAGCCGGPMQFNVTNGGAGIPSTWDLVSNSYTYGKRPAAYDHMTAKHPSIYDDFDSIMGAARLLSADGAGYSLDGSAWDAAYDYYGHDATGVTYADEVLARAIGWSQHGFCINCATEVALLNDVHDAYGTPVLAALQTPTAFAARVTKPKRAR